MVPPERSARRPLDAAALDRIVQRMRRADAAPWLHREAARRMAERLPVIKLQPDRVLDWWAQLGGGRAELARCYPRAALIAVEPRPELAPRRAWWARWTAARDAAIAEAQVPEAAGQLVWCNMGLHLMPDPQAALRGWHRALAVDGFLMFSTLGPGSLATLRELYREAGWTAPHAPFVDMHDLGDMLVEAGFADPVMDQETLTLSWATPDAALAELRTLGGNADPARAAGLRTPRWRARLAALLRERAADADGRVRLAFELVYGHAFRPPPRAKVAATTRVPLADLRAMVRSGRRGQEDAGA
jgi:malonyl-CoA O-methyltransferase